MPKHNKISRIVALNFVHDQLPCPHCGKGSSRHDIRSRTARDIDLENSTTLFIVYSYHCCKKCIVQGKNIYFSAPTDGVVSAYKRNSNRTILKMFESVELDGVTYNGTSRRMQRDFHTSTVPSTVWKTINSRNGTIKQDILDYQARAIKTFSGQMSIDEAYVGCFAVITVSDSLNERVIAQEIIKGSVTQAVLRPFLLKLKALGLKPLLVTRDGSPLYPNLINEIWKDVKQGACHFHLTQDATKSIIKAVGEERKKIAIPNLKRGRLNPDERKKNEELKKLQDKKTEVFRKRFLVVKAEHSEEEKAIWDRLIVFFPILIIFRNCITEFYQLLRSKSEEDFKVNLDNWRNNPDYQKYCGDVLAILKSERKILEAMAHLDFVNAQRTSDDVERQNRCFKGLIKHHEGLRTLSTITLRTNMLALRKDNTAIKQNKLVKKAA